MVGGDCQSYSPSGSEASFTQAATEPECIRSIFCGHSTCSTGLILRASCKRERIWKRPARKINSYSTEGWSSDTEADAREIIRLSTCAIDRDPSNALALAIQGHGRSMFFRDYDTALDLFDRALAISPSNSWAWVLSAAGTYGFIGDARSGIARAERAIRLSPLDQQAFFNLCLLAQNHYLNGTFDEAIRWSRKALNFNPRFGNATRVLAASQVAAGRLADAHQVALHHKQILPRFRVSDYARRCNRAELSGVASNIEHAARPELLQRVMDEMFLDARLQ